MRVLTEESLRSESKNSPLKEIIVDKNTLITPSAREFINSRGISLKFQEDLEGIEEVEEVKEEKEVNYKYKSYYSGRKYLEKPEYMTEIYKDILVYKTHERIEFRGKLDSFQGKIMVLQAKAYEDKEDKLLADLDDLLGLSKSILRSEIMEEDLNQKRVLGYSLEDLRDMSHRPEEYFNMGHLVFDYKMGYYPLKLNELRTLARELELCGFRAFKSEEGFMREDILTGLNRLSSVIYVMIYRYLTDRY